MDGIDRMNADVCVLKPYPRPSAFIPSIGGPNEKSPPRHSGKGFKSSQFGSYLASPAGASLAPGLGLPLRSVCFAKRFLNLSTRPAVSMSIILPV